MDAELVVTPPGCSHLSSFKVDNWKQNLRAIYQCFVWSGTAEARKRKVRPSPPPYVPTLRAGPGAGDPSLCSAVWHAREGVLLGPMGGERERLGRAR